MDILLSNDPLARDPESCHWPLGMGVIKGAATIATAVPIVSPFACSERAKAVICFPHEIGQMLRLVFAWLAERSRGAPRRPRLMP